MKVSEIKSPVSAISGVGPQLSKCFSKLNIFTVGDLLSFYPRDYEDRSVKIFLKEFKNHSKIHTVAKVLSQEWFGYGRMKTLKIVISDGTARADLICFNRAFLEKVLVPGKIITVTGQFYVKYNTLQSSSFDASVMKISGDEIKSAEELIRLQPLNSGIVPIYHLTEGLTQKTVSKTVATALAQYGRGIENELPDDLIEKRDLLSKQIAINFIHQPENIEQMLDARRTLAYEELYLFQKVIGERALKHRGFLPDVELGNLMKNDCQLKPENDNGDNSVLSSGLNVMSSSGLTRGSLTNDQFISSLSPLQKQFLEKIPFELTPDQKNVIYEMDAEIDRGYEERNKILLADETDVAEIKAPFTMARLLQGDVGSGKTLTALFVCLRIISWKGQCAFMAPTEILAHQHADTTAKMLDCLGVRTAFLTGNVKSFGRTQILKALKNGEIDIIIGTHALFSSDVVYNDLELAVIDEQHRFGVMQRQAIIAKGRNSEKKGIVFEPHLLMMSATPIPQTLALTVFGDLDVSTIRTKPEGRKPIQTYLIKEGNEFKAYEAVRKELEAGHQAYFVYPAIDSDYDFTEENDMSGEHWNSGDSGRKLKSAEKNFVHLSKNIFPQYKCAMVHSKVSEEEQQKILKDFHDGKIQILVATTVIEVGVDVPNATCMVIEMADRFGMAQLHQLRGRVGRGSNQSMCILIYSKNLTETGIERMKVLRQSTDGFYIAEQDLKTRGPGEINGTLQAGALELGIADIIRDKDLLMQARIDAFEMLSVTD